MIRPIDQCENNAIALMDNSRFRADCAALILAPVAERAFKARVIASGWGILPDTMGRCIELLYGERI